MAALQLDIPREFIWTDGGTVATRGLLRICRDRRFRFFARAFKIVVDGSDISRVRNGKAVSLPLAPGRHELRVQIDWQSSEPLEIEVPAAGIVTVRCFPNSDPLASAHALSKKYAPIRLELVTATSGDATQIN